MCDELQQVDFLPGAMDLITKMQREAESLMACPLVTLAVQIEEAQCWHDHWREEVVRRTETCAGADHAVMQFAAARVKLDGLLAQFVPTLAADVRKRVARLRNWTQNAYSFQELVEAQSEQAKKPTPVLHRVCAWCWLDMGTRPADASMAGKTSHGICEACAAKHVAETEHLAAG